MRSARRGHWLLAAVACSVASAADHGPRPNIILMLADDQGWDGLSTGMAPGVPASRSPVFHTPRLAALAAQGMRFSNAYAPAPVCSPTRISLQTGRSPAALHWTKAAPPEEGRRLLEPRLIKRIAAEETTVGEILRAAHYRTAHYGKWHIGGGGPALHGYDESDGDTGNEHAALFTDPNPVDIFGMAERAEAFMARCRLEEKPFYMQLSWNALHAAENARRATIAKYERQLGAGDRRTMTAAITEDLDTGVGRVLDAIDRLGLAGTTYVIYTSDNGAGGRGKGTGGGRAAGLAGGKGSAWEGGIRVPFIIRGPGIAADSWCHVPIVGYDLFPTFCVWAGVPSTALPLAIEGTSIARLVTGQGADLERLRGGILFHFPHYQNGHTPHSAIREGNLKLIRFYEDDSVRLFDLDADRAERDDLSDRRPGDAARLRDRLDRSLVEIGADLPTPNPRFDPMASPVGKPRAKAPRKGGGDNDDRPVKKKRSA